MFATLPPTALIVIDDEEKRYALARPLLQAGFNIRGATNGIDGLRAATEAPEIILLDLHLPDMSGFEVCCRLKAHAATAAIPVLHLSDTPVECNEFAGHLERGDEAYLTYPVEATELLASVSLLLRGRQTHRQFSSFLEAAPDAVIIVDQHGKIVRVNGQAEKIFGYGREELMGQDVEILIPQRFRERHQDQRNDFIAHPITRPMGSGINLLGMRKDGSEFPVEISLSAIPDHQGILVASIVRDVTERRRIEEKLRDADRKKDEFLAMLSHELRNPLASITMAAQLLGLQKNENRLQQEARTTIERQVGQLTRLIGDLLEVSRITAGKLHLQQDQVALNEIVEHAIETVRPLLDQHKHQLTLSLSENPIWLYADASRLEQVIVNLLTNSAKYTNENGNIWLTTEQLGDECVLRVRDSGVGIAPELLPHIFDMFTQEERSLGRSQGGLGIGLSLVQQIVAMHRGRVEVFSTLGQGSEFVVRLPVITVPKPQPPSIHQATAERVQSALRVLIVDDIADNAQMLEMLLSASGYDVLTTHDGPSALRAALDYAPDVVLLDIGLPGMDGYEVARTMRQQPIFKDVVLVALTGYEHDSARQRSHEAGFDHHLVKPLDFANLKQILASVPKKI